MVKVVTQETFDDIVRENIDEFCMDVDEAIEDAIKQLQAQGVDLTYIIKDSIKETSNVKLIIEKIQALTKTSPKDLTESLTQLKEYCDKDIAHRLHAAKEGAYDSLLKVINLDQIDSCTKIVALNTMISLTSKQPDIFDIHGVETIVKLLNNEENNIELNKTTLKWTNECCIKHEINRQRIFDSGLLEILKKLLKTTPQEVCSVVRSLILDDDIRHEYGRASEHARIIAIELLCDLVSLLHEYKHEEELVSELLLTIAALLVRNEFCQMVSDAGIVRFIFEVCVDYYDSDKLNRQAFKLIKALSGNDSCKSDIIKQGGASVIASSLSRHKNVAATATAGLACVSSLALRVPENSKALFESGIPDIIVDCMKSHPNNVGVQKQGSYAVRNMVSRSKYQNEHFLSLGIEDQLNAALKMFREECGDDVRAALRDLECKVELKEQWTGKGTQMDRDDNIQYS